MVTLPVYQYNIEKVSLPRWRLIIPRLFGEFISFFAGGCAIKGHVYKKRFYITEEIFLGGVSDVNPNPPSR